VRHVEVTTPTPRFAELGARIRKARKRTGISQERLAPLVGTTRRHLIRLENGEHQASKPLAARLGAALGEDAAQFRNGDADDEEEDEAVDALMSALRRVVRNEMGRWEA
jgi:transcriptional regulator with XRE-family HTH domain